MESIITIVGCLMGEQIDLVLGYQILLASINLKMLNIKVNEFTKFALTGSPSRVSSGLSSLSLSSVWFHRRFRGPLLPSIMVALLPSLTPCPCWSTGHHPQERSDWLGVGHPARHPLLWHGTDFWLGENWRIAPGHSLKECHQSLGQ